MENQYTNIEQQVITYVKEIIVPLRGKEINEQAFTKLFAMLGQLNALVKNEDMIGRKVVGYLFYLYTQLEIQLSYAGDFQKEPIVQKKIALLRYLREIFGSIKENGESVK